MISQQRTAHLGICAAAVVMASSLGVLIAGTGDANAPASNKQKSVDANPQATNPAGNAELSASIDVSHMGGLPQSK